MKFKRALLCVDVQNDFCQGGALAVPGGDEIIPVLNGYIELFVKMNLPIFASRDWHPRTSKHFSQYGGQWPKHCVQQTKGARFHSQLQLPRDAIILSKGMNPEEDSYSAFEARDSGGVAFREILNLFGVDYLFIGGLATDYCVQRTVLDALKVGFKVKLLTDAIRGVNVRAKDSETAVRRMVRGGAVKMTLKRCASVLLSARPETCDHIGLFTKNARRLTTFYVETLGFVKEKEERLPTSLVKAALGVNADCHMIRLVAGEVKLELFQPVALQLLKSVKPTVGYHHWGYDVGDRLRFVRKLMRKGVHIIEVDRNSHTVYFLKDPDGNRIEIRGET